MGNNVWIINHYASDTFFDNGGRHYSIAKYLRKRGYNLTIFCCNAMHNSDSKLYFDNNTLWDMHIQRQIDVPYVFVKGYPYKGNGKSRILNILGFYRDIKKAAKQYASSNEKPDVIIGSSVHPLACVAALKLAKYFEVKCIIEIRDLWPESIVAYGIAGANNPIVIALRILEKWIYKKADRIVFTMENAYQYIEEQGWNHQIPQTKICYINNGVDLEAFEYNRMHYKIDDSDLNNKSIFKVVYAGSIRKVNNLSQLLDVAKEIRNPNIKFLIWGDGEELEMLKGRIKTESISNVEFKGRVDKKYVPYIVSNADLNFAHNNPSYLFNYGISFNKLFDYLAAGKPVLFDFASEKNPAIMNCAGIEVPNPTPYNVATAIEHIATIKNTNEYNNYCRQATITAQDYSFENLSNKLDKLIRGDI